MDRNVTFVWNMVETGGLSGRAPWTTYYASSFSWASSYPFGRYRKVETEVPRFQTNCDMHTSLATNYPHPAPLAISSVLLGG